VNDGQSEIICHLLLGHRQQSKTLSGQAGAVKSDAEIEQHCCDPLLGAAAAEAGYPTMNAALVLADLLPKADSDIRVLPGEFQYLAMIERLDRNGAQSLESVRLLD
jgi:hypothetical protein